jgi:acetyl-CoA acetyltransferase
MRDAMIVGAVRTPVGKRNGALSAVRPDDLAATVLAELVRRAGIDPTEIEDVVFGCVDQLGEQGMNIARNAALIAGLPLDVCGTTLDRMCGSGQQALNFAAMGVMSGQYEVVIAGGVEHMTRVPMGSNAVGPGDGPLSPRLHERARIVPQGVSAELLAESPSAGASSGTSWTSSPRRVTRRPAARSRRAGSLPRSCRSPCPTG